MSKQNWSRLIEDLRSSNVEHAVRASEKISEIADENNIPELYSLLNDESFFVREAVAFPLVRLEGVDALAPLLQAYKRGFHDGHDNDGLNFAIVELLEENQEEAAPLLLNMLKKSDSETRKFAAWALGFVSSQISPVYLLEVIDNDERADVRSAAIVSLSSFKEYPEIFDKLVSLLHDPNLYVKSAAIAALGYWGDRRAIKPLQKMLKGASEAIRFSIQFAMERITQESS